MAAISKQELENASVDAQTLSQVTNGADNVDVTSRLGKIYPTLAKWFKDRGVDFTAFIASKQAEFNVVIVNAGTALTNFITTSNNAIVNFTTNSTAVLASAGYLVPVTYVSGISLTTPNQTVSYNGQVYAPIQNQLPFVTSGTFETAKFRLIQGVAAADLSSATGFAMVGYLTNIVNGKLRTGLSKLNDSVNVRDFGAICDGVSRPLSTKYASLSLAQADFPSAQSLTDELDSVAIQLCFDSIPAYSEVVIRGVPVSNKPIYLNKSGVKVNATGAVLKIRNSNFFSLIIHGGTVDRNLAYPAWPVQFLEMAYETSTPVNDVTISGLTIESFTGSKIASQMMAIFANNCIIDVTVNDSNGSGVEFRQCVNPKYNKINAKNCSTFALFTYQCHGLIGGELNVENCGRAFDIKQRHKFYSTLSHKLNTITAIDCIGFGDPVWCTGGVAYNELVRAGASSAAIAARNFTGHEICRDVIIERIDLLVTTSGLATASTPSFHIGAYSDNWSVKKLSFNGSNIDSGTIPLIIGSRGDIAEGIAGGATFGKNHSLTDILFQNFIFTNANPLIQYGVTCSIIGVNHIACDVLKILDQADSSILPFGNVASLEYRKSVGNITLGMGPIGERGVRVLEQTLQFISGGNSLIFKPKNNAANAICCPWYVKSDSYITLGRDELSIVDGSTGASNHTTTYGYFTTAVKGNINCKISAFAPATVRAIGLASSVATKALILEPCELILSNTPTGEKTAIYVLSEVLNLAGHIFTGPWVNNISDSSGKVIAQNIKRRLDAGAIPTTGDYNQGDEFKNTLPRLANPVGRWVATASGTPGTWAVESFITFRGPTGSRPTLAANAVGIIYMDTTLAGGGKPIMWNGSNWVDFTGTIV